MLRVDGDGRITDFEEKPINAETSTVSTGVYIVRRRMLIELIEKSMQEERYDFVKDILIRYKNVKKIYAYPMDSYWSNISSVDSYYNTNMDFLNKDIRIISSVNIRTFIRKLRIFLRLNIMSDQM